MRPRRILIFGGTGEARDLANRLTDDGIDVVTALAGVTREPNLPRGGIHLGGLGGADGIAAFIAKEKFDHIVDATHPFAAKIAASIALAAQRLQLPCLRLEREPWRAAEGDLWTEVADFEEAAAELPDGARALLTIGHRGLEPFLARSDLSGVIRVIEAPRFELRCAWRLVRSRPPHALADELRLLDEERLTHLVTKNSGGAATESKLIAARERKIPVVMIARPIKPLMAIFTNVEGMAEALKA